MDVTRFRRLLRHLEGHMGHPADLMLGVGHDVRGLLLAVRFLCAVLAEVHAADQLPHHHKVDAAGRDIRPEGAGVGQLGEHPGGTDICIQPHSAPQLEKSPFGTVCGGLVIPLGATHRAQQNAVGLQTGFQTGIRQRDAEGVNGVAAHGGVHIGEGVAEFFSHRIQNLDGLPYDLRADAVSLDDCDGLVHCAASLSFRDAIRPPLAIMSLINGGKGSA